MIPDRLVAKQRVQQKKQHIVLEMIAEKKLLINIFKICKESGGAVKSLTTAKA